VSPYVWINVAIKFFNIIPINVFP